MLFIYLLGECNIISSFNNNNNKKNSMWIGLQVDSQDKSSYFTKPLDLSGNWYSLHPVLCLCTLSKAPPLLRPICQFHELTNLIPNRFVNPGLIIYKPLTWRSIKSKTMTHPQITHPTIQDWPRPTSANCMTQSNCKLPITKKHFIPCWI